MDECLFGNPVNDHQFDMPYYVGIQHEVFAAQHHCAAVVMGVLSCILETGVKLIPWSTPWVQTSLALCTLLLICVYKVVKCKGSFAQKVFI